MGKRRKKLKGKVERIIKSPYSQEEKAQIEIEGADDLYKEIRVENVVTDEQGEKTKLQEGESVDVFVETDSKSSLTQNAKQDEASKDRKH